MVEFRSLGRVGIWTNVRQWALEPDPAATANDIEQLGFRASQHRWSQPAPWTSTNVTPLPCIGDHGGWVFPLGSCQLS